jgi:hypothetical protein
MTTGYNYRQFMGSASKKSKSPEVVTSIKLERSKLAEFRALARSNERSVSGQMRVLIDQALDERRVSDGQTEAAA